MELSHVFSFCVDFRAFDRISLYGVNNQLFRSFSVRFYHNWYFGPGHNPGGIHFTLSLFRKNYHVNYFYHYFSHLYTDHLYYIYIYAWIIFQETLSDFYYLWVHFCDLAIINMVTQAVTAYQ